MHYPLTDIQADFDINRQITAKINYFHRRQTDGRTDRQTDRQTDGRTDGQTDGQMSRTRTIGSFFRKRKNTKNDNCFKKMFSQKLLS